jgi:hypothetical protein
MFKTLFVGASLVTSLVFSVPSIVSSPAEAQEEAYELIKESFIIKTAFDDSVYAESTEGEGGVYFLKSDMLAQHVDQWDNFKVGTEIVVSFERNVNETEDLFLYAEVK